MLVNAKGCSDVTKGTELWTQAPAVICVGVENSGNWNSIYLSPRNGNKWDLQDIVDSICHRNDIVMTSFCPQPQNWLIKSSKRIALCFMIVFLAIDCTKQLVCLY